MVDVVDPLREDGWRCKMHTLDNEVRRVASYNQLSVHFARVRLPPQNSKRLSYCQFIWIHIFIEIYAISLPNYFAFKEKILTGFNLFR